MIVRLFRVRSLGCSVSGWGFSFLGFILQLL